MLAPFLYDEFAYRGRATPEHDLMMNVILCAVRDYTSMRTGSAGKRDARSAKRWLYSNASAEQLCSFRWYLSFFVRDVESTRLRILDVVEAKLASGGGEYNLQYGIWKKVRRKKSAVSC
jgi:hypothetical protein